jgi:hypothetical protein
MIDAVIQSICYSVLTTYAGKEHWDKTLNDYLTNKFQLSYPIK